VGQFFIENPVGALILTTVGAILAGIYLEKRHQVHKSIAGKITREGFGYNFTRLLGHIFRLLFIAWMVEGAISVHRKTGFPNGASFMYYIFFALYYLAWEMRSCGITAEWAFDRTEAIGQAFSRWVKPKSPDKDQGILAAAVPIEELIERLDGSVYSDTFPAERELQRRQVESVEPLIQALSTSEGNQFERVCFLLGKTGDPRAVAALMQVLETGGYVKGRDAAYGLSRAPEKSISLLASALESDNMEVVEAAAFSLGFSRDVRSVKPLAALFKKSIKHLQEAASDMYRSQYTTPSTQAGDRYSALVERVQQHRNDSAWDKAQAAAKALATLAELALKKQE